MIAPVPCACLTRLAFIKSTQVFVTNLVSGADRAGRAVAARARASPRMCLAAPTRPGCDNSAPLETYLFLCGLFLTRVCCLKCCVGSDARHLASQDRCAPKILAHVGPQLSGRRSKLSDWPRPASPPATNFWFHAPYSLHRLCCVVKFSSLQSLNFIAALFWSS